MAAKRSRVGNAAVYLGLPWAQRKSLPRDSRGFEPLDKYFVAKDHSDGDSSDSETEQLIQEEKRRRKAQQRQTAPDPEPPQPRQVTAQYSPAISILTAHEDEEPSTKVPPSRLTFDSESDTDRPFKSARRSSRRKTAQLTATSDKSMITASPTQDPVSVTSRKPLSTVSRNALSVFEPLSSIDDDAGPSLTRDEVSFHPKKTSTQAPVQKEAVAAKKPRGRKKTQLSAIAPLIVESDSDEEEDSIVQSLMTGSQFWGLAKLTQRISSEKSPKISLDPVGEQATETGNQSVKRKLAFSTTASSTQSQQATSKKQVPKKTTAKKTHASKQPKLSSAKSRQPATSKTDISKQTTASTTPALKQPTVRITRTSQQITDAKTPASNETVPERRTRSKTQQTDSIEQSQWCVPDYEPGNTVYETQPETEVKRKYAKKSAQKGGSSNSTPAEASMASVEAQSAGTTSAAPSQLVRKTKKRKRLGVPTTKPRKQQQPKQDKQSSTEEDTPVKKYPRKQREPQQTHEPSSSEDWPEITISPGGRRYQRVRVDPVKSHTPGVRRSHRTKIAPVKHWEDEKVEYDTRRKSGALIKGVLLPMERPHTAATRRKARGRAPEKEQPPEELPPLPILDTMGNTVEVDIVRKLSSAEQVNNLGEAADADDEVVINKLFSSMATSNGIITLNAFGQKERCRTKNYEMYFYVMKGAVDFEVNQQQYPIPVETAIHIPAGTVYTMTNPNRKPASIYFYTCMITE